MTHPSIPPRRDVGTVKGPGDVELSIGGTKLRLGCEPGEEARLVDSARLLDQTIRHLRSRVPGATEMRLLLMAALSLSDELNSMRAARLDSANPGLSGHSDAQFDALEMQMAQILGSASERIEEIALRLEALVSENEASE
ncbi:MAG: cell division protein ZapA [Neomegalonema sp.]|nr:cell division protein ZapA [Neomegalonema sp.]